MPTLDKFIAGLKKKLRETNVDDFVDSGYYDYGGMTGSGCNITVDWEVLDKEIDAFCAQFKEKK